SPRGDTATHEDRHNAPKRSGAVAAAAWRYRPARLGARRAHPQGRPAGCRPGEGDSAPRRSPRSRTQSQLTARVGKGARVRMLPFRSPWAGRDAVTALERAAERLFGVVADAASDFADPDVGRRQQ